MRRESNDLKHGLPVAIVAFAARFPVRLSVLAMTRSNSNIYAQVIDDVSHTTICGVSTLGPGSRQRVRRGGTVEGAAEIGTIIGKMAQEKGRHRGRFRPWRPYHGREGSGRRCS